MLRCDLSNNKNPELDCTLDCTGFPGGEVVDLASFCAVPCGCPALDPTIAGAPPVSGDVDRFALGNVNRSSCSAAPDGSTFTIIEADLAFGLALALVFAFALTFALAFAFASSLIGLWRSSRLWHLRDCAMLSLTSVLFAAYA